MPKSIKPGNYTVREVLAAADFDLAEKAKADYSEDGIDRRLVRIGGLPFDSEDQTIHIPVTADEVVITLDGKSAVTLTVELDEQHKKERAYSFSTAVDAEDPKK